MASRNHTKQGTAGAFGHDGQNEDQQYRVRGRNAGGKLHRRGEGRKETSSIVAQAAVVHMEKAETALEAKIVAALAQANAAIRIARAAEADQVLRAAQQARQDICNIAHVPSAAERNARIAQIITAHN